MLDDVLMHVKDLSRIVLCGTISSYNNIAKRDADSAYRLKNYSRMIIKRCRMQGFLYFDYVK
jgi:NADPH-dependent curcumin reductase CurA